MKTKLLTLSILIISVSSLKSQQIGNGYAPTIVDYSDILISGVYGGVGANGATPDNSYGGWQHLFVIRHENTSNNHQFQLATSYTVNDRLFFRKIASGLSPSNTQWIELATRGENTYKGSQIFNENIGIGYPNPTSKFVLSAPSGTMSIDGMGLGFNRSAREGLIFNSAISAWQFSARNEMFTLEGYYGVAHDLLSVLKNGNILIGKTTQNNSNYKLDVAGKIRADEIIVNTTGADFVFAPTYKLRPLSEVEQFIKTNGHLPEIPKAEEVQQNGVNLGEMQTKLLQKVEELTLYLIEQEKVKVELKATVDQQVKNLNDQAKESAELKQKLADYENELKQLKELLTNKLNN